MTTNSDTFTKYGAHQLAMMIEDYWRSRGYTTVKAWRYELEGFEGLWGVMSNLVAGVPPHASATIRLHQVTTADIGDERVV